MKNVFGQWKFLKRLLVSLVGVVTWPRFVWTNKSVIAGMAILRKLPSKNVVFVSNHQTYFADVMLMYHAFSAAKWKLKRGLRNPIYLLSPKINVYYVAALETMKSGLLPKLFAYGGAVSIQRTWREAGENIKREVNPQDPENIGKAIRSGWLITFPQGTTKPFEKGRKGTAHLIKEHRPIVVPITIDGFRRAFDKKGLTVKKRDSRLLMKIYEPLVIDYDAPAQEILDQIMYAIRQSPEFMKVNLLSEEQEK